MKMFGNKKKTAGGKAGHEGGGRLRKFRKVMIVSLCVLLLGAGAVYAVGSLYIKPPEVAVYTPQATAVPIAAVVQEEVEEEEEEPEGNRPSGIYTVLVVGQDEAGGNTDTMMLCSVDSINGGLNIVSLPRDTMVDVPWSPQKLNSVMSLTGSIDGLMDAVEEIAGFRPDNYVVVDLEAFVELVDAIGGVDFDVPRNMYYDDPAQDLSIHLEAGYQHLDGEQAVGVFRWRQNNDGTGYINGDIGRIETQQAFLMAVAEQLLQIQNVTKITELAEIFVNYVDTDLPLSSLIWYATQLMGMDSEDIQFITMPGNYDVWYDGISYVLIDVEEWLDTVNTYLNPFPDEVLQRNVRIYTTDEQGVLRNVGWGRSLTAA